MMNSRIDSVVVALLSPLQLTGMYIMMMILIFDVAIFMPCSPWLDIFSSAFFLSCHRLLSAEHDGKFVMTTERFCAIFFCDNFSRSLSFLLASKNIFSLIKVNFVEIMRIVVIF